MSSTAWPGGKPPRICFVETADFAFLSHRIHLGRAAKRAGMDVHVISPRGSHGEQLRAEGFTHHTLRMDRASTNPLTEVNALRDLTALYRAIRPDVAHHIALKSILYGSFAARVARVPAVVASVTGLGYSFIPGGARRAVLREAVSLMLRSALSGRTHTIFQNPDDREFFVERKLVAQPRTSLVLGSGVDTERFTPGAVPTGDVVVTAGTRMLWDKGIGELIAARRVLASRGVVFKLRLAGTPDPANPASVPLAKLHEWQARGDVEWLGNVDDMAALLRESHIACLPSYREGLPLFLAEAAAAGLPAVTTDVPGCRTVVRHGETGLLVPVRDASATAEALGTLIGDPEIRARMGIAARHFALEHFSKETVVASVFGIYRRLLAQERP